MNGSIKCKKVKCLDRLHFRKRRKQNKIIRVFRDFQYPRSIDWCYYV